MARTLLIAGGNSGIGLESVRKLAAEPDTRVVCAVRDPDPLSEIPGVETLPFDATGETPEAETLPEVIDGFVYFPGTISLKPFHRFTDEDFLDDLQVNFLGATRLLRASLPALKKSEGASIVFFSTVAVGTGMPFHSSIAAAKGAVEAFARAMAAELAPRIRVNAIAPSLTDTPLAEALLSSEDRIEASRKRHPLQRIGAAAEVADAVSFLLGSSSGFISGQTIRIDGGLSSLRLL